MMRTAVRRIVGGRGHYHPPDTAPVRHSAEVHFGWVLQDPRVQECGSARAPRPPGLAQPADLYGTTVRVYDPAADAWNVTG